HRVHAMDQRRHAAIARVDVLDQAGDVARHRVEPGQDLVEVAGRGAPFGDGAFGIEHQRLVGQQAPDIAFALVDPLHRRGQRLHRPAGIVRDGKYLRAHLVDQRADAFGGGALRYRLDHREVPVELRPRAAADVDEGRAGDAETPPDDAVAVAADEGFRLVV